MPTTMRTRFWRNSKQLASGPKAISATRRSTTRSASTRWPRCRCCSWWGSARRRRRPFRSGATASKTKKSCRWIKPSAQLRPEQHPRIEERAVRYGLRRAVEGGAGLSTWDDVRRGLDFCGRRFRIGDGTKRLGGSRSGFDDDLNLFQLPRLHAEFARVAQAAMAGDGGIIGGGGDMGGGGGGG